MIAEMEKLNLIAMSYDRDAVLNALQKTNAAEVKLHTERAQTQALPSEGGELREYLASLESALDALTRETEAYLKARKLKSDVLSDGFEVSYGDFMAAREKRAEADALVAQINALSESRNACKTELASVRRTIAAAEPYARFGMRFSAFRETAHTRARLGIVPVAAKQALTDALALVPTAAFAVYGEENDWAVIAVFSHKSESETDGLLQEAGFVSCPFEGDRTGEELYADLKEKERAIEEKDAAACERFFRFSEKIAFLKTYCDYVAFELEKAELSDKLRGTERTFLLEAYVPKIAEERVKEALTEVSHAVYFEFSEVPEDEIPPTLMRNNPVARNFETITNLYSPPNARELDPTSVMAFFYSVFLGFIMGDVGYGLLMTVGGGLVYYKNRARDGGLKRLAGVFAIGGLFAIVWGLLFNSVFGITLPFLKTVMPDAQKDMWTFIGIKIPSVLVISLLIGIVQLFAGYCCRAAQDWRRKQVVDGILDGVVWAVFSLGVGLAIVGFIEEAKVSFLAKIGGVTAGVALAVAILTAGRKEKLLGKFTKGFGAAYGVINYASDVLSYARLYGLMLSGAVIAQIVSQYAVQFITGGNVVFAILGVVLMIVGHAFNLAIGLLGAYIHDARLQYVEFYGRFYEGEGELFSPLGSRHKYVYLAPCADAEKK
ncbi:MAG: V-type ATP synthase subunit I [Candidatus Gallimonas sp.]